MNAITGFIQRLALQGIGKLFPLAGPALNSFLQRAIVSWKTTTLGALVSTAFLVVFGVDLATANYAALIPMLTPLIMGLISTDATHAQDAKGNLIAPEKPVV